MLFSRQLEARHVVHLHGDDHYYYTTIKTIGASGEGETAKQLAKVSKPTPEANRRWFSLLTPSGKQKGGRPWKPQT